MTNTDSASPQDIFMQRFDRMLESRGGHTLAVFPSGPLQFGECKARMLMYCGAFAKLGLLPGDRALLRSGQDDILVPMVLALMRAGVTPVVADQEATVAECTELAELAKVSVVFADIEVGEIITCPCVNLQPYATGRMSLAALIDGPAPTSFGVIQQTLDRALLVLTSGTTSRPKAVELTHANLLAQLDIFERVYGFDPEMRLMNLLPLHHVDGMIRGPLAALWFGGTVYRQAPFSVQGVPQILQCVADRNITHFISVPAMLRIIERVGRDQRNAFNYPAFRFVLSSADLLDAALWRQFEATFQVPVVNVYGLSEVVCDALFAGPEPETRCIGTLGRPVGCEARVVDEQGILTPPNHVGELVLTGPTVMRGYFNAPEVTDSVLQQGAFHTGDYVKVDRDGNFIFVGRKKTAIVSAGHTIHPETAIQALASMPGILEAVAFGVPDPAMGQKLVAAVVPAPGYVLTPADIAAHCRTLLAPERVPREYRILSTLPRGASGKVKIDAVLAMTAATEIQPEALDVLTVASRCFNLDVEALSLESTPFDTEGWDSLAHMALIEALEDAFEIRFTPTQIAMIMSLADASTFIQEALTERQQG
jgi:long-chain acyl-CoA synthetase